ncbi:MAG: hypothetical protein JRG74_08840 [Deltaproteobacteria bacterium]|nr:hypothetical protein [Deltaproteobacteria bacterium]
MIIANLHVKYHAVKTFLVYPGDPYLSIGGVEIIPAAGNSTTAFFRAFLMKRISSLEDYGLSGKIQQLSPSDYFPAIFIGIESCH